MIRRATRDDLPCIIAIRDGAGDNPLSDPQALTDADAASCIDDGALLVWEEAGGMIAGFAAADVHRGAIRTLLVAPGHEGKGIGRALLQAACDTLRGGGHRAATLSAEPGSQAERHYRRAGWSDAGTDDAGRLVLRKPF